MKTLILFLLIYACAVCEALPQSTLVYDQQSSSDEASPFGSVPIQFYGSVGQSFTPSLSAVGFVRLRQFDISPGNALGATLVVNLRSNAINGPILGTTMPLVLNDGFAGSANFLFVSAVPVTSSTTYFFETLVQSGDNWGITTLGDAYLGGTAFGSGFPFPGSDLWFREGIVLPEPSSVSLLLLGAGMAVWFVRRRH